MNAIVEPFNGTVVNEVAEFIATARGDKEEPEPHGGRRRLTGSGVKQRAPYASAKC